MSKKILKDSLGWGIALWLIGYVLGFIFFFILPASMIGWAIMPFGIAITLWVLLKKVKGGDLRYYLTLAVVWTVIAIAFDFAFLVQTLKPADGYYKLDVYIYYALTFIIPLLVGYQRKDEKSKKL